jgi:hypothetical protein
MTIYQLISDNLPILRTMHRNGVSGNYIAYLPIYEDYKRLVAEGNKVRWVAQAVAEKYGYKERMVRLIVKMMDEQVQE